MHHARSPLLSLLRLVDKVDIVLVSLRACHVIVTSSATIFVRRHGFHHVSVLRQLCVTSPCGALIGPPTAFRRNGPSVPWGVLAGTHWGDDLSRVMSHQSANPCGCVM